MPQLFISYSHADVSWADVLHKRLEDRGISCFFDEASIRVGEDWNIRIRSDLMASDHMLVLWSKEAKSSDWVRTEIGRFDALIGMDIENHGATKRKLIFLLMDTDEQSHQHDQQITRLKNSGAYPGDPSTIAYALWSQIVNEVQAAVTDDRNSIPVSLAVLALTSSRFDSLYSQNLNGFATSVNSALSSIGIDYSEPSAFSDFKQRYGNHPTNWKPFDGKEDVFDILESVRLEFNQRVDHEGKHFKWARIGEKFYEGDNEDASNELQRIRRLDKNHLACFVIDPISLFDNCIVEKLNILDSFFDDENTIILVLTPVVLIHHIRLLKLIRDKATAFFNRQHYSAVRRRYAHFAMNIGAESDIGRVLRAAMGPHVYRQSSSSIHSHAYTSLG